MDTAILLALTLVYLVYLISDSFGDVAIELGKQKEWHLWGAIMASIFNAVLSYAIFRITWYTLVTFISITILRLPLFNLLHNIAKKQPWWYIGTTAKTDILIRKWIKWMVNNFSGVLNYKIGKWFVSSPKLGFGIFFIVWMCTKAVQVYLYGDIWWWVVDTIMCITGIPAYLAGFSMLFVRWDKLLNNE